MVLELNGVAITPGVPHTLTLTFAGSAGEWLDWIQIIPETGGGTASP